MVIKILLFIRHLPIKNNCFKMNKVNNVYAFLEIPLSTTYSVDLILNQQGSLDDFCPSDIPGYLS